MKVMAIIKATKSSEAGAMPSEELLMAMGRYNEELVKAGVLLDGDGLKPSRAGKRVLFAGGTKKVVEGPFAYDEGLVAGFWIWEVKSMDEAVEWAMRCPNPMPGEEAQIELRPMVEPEDFGEAFTPELQAKEDELRAEVQRQHGRA